MIRTARFILGHQRLILIGMAVVLGLGLWQRMGLENSQSLQALIVRGDRRQQAFERMARMFGGDEVLAVGIEADSVYRPAVLAAVDRLSRQIAAEPAVSQVTSVTTVQRFEPTFVFGLPGPPRERPLYDPDGGETGAARVQAYLESHPLYRGRLVSTDGRMALIVVTFTEAAPEAINEATTAIEGLVNAASAEESGLSFLLAGRPLMRIELIRAAQKDVDRLLYVALAVVAAILAAAFRRPTPVVLAVAVVVVGVLLMQGVIAALGVRMNNLLVMVPALVLIIGSSVSMHLLTRYTSERRAGSDVRRATARAVIHAGPSCFWATATTAIGFLGLITSRVPALRQCGAFSAVGVSLSFVVALAIIPTVLTLRRRDRTPYEPDDADLKATVLTSPATTFISRFVVRFRAPVLVLALLVAAACVYGITRLDVETNRLDYFHRTDPLRVAYRGIEDRFGGLTNLDVLIEGDRDGWLTPEAVRRIDVLRQALEDLDDVDHSLSLVSLLSHANQVYGGAAELPENDVQLAAMLGFVTNGARTAWTRMFLSADGRTARIILYTRLKGSAEIERLIGRTTALTALHGVPGARASVTGSAVVFAGMVDYVVSGQIRGLIVVMAILLVIMCFLTERVWAGVVALVPTVIPILMLYGTMAVMGFPLNLHTSIVSALAAGIAIDNAIHFLSAFKRAYRRSGDYEGAVRTAIHVIGRALIVNCLLIAGGLGAFTQGEQLPVRQFGLLLALTMVNAMVMGLVLLPALLLVLRPRIGRRARVGG